MKLKQWLYGAAALAMLAACSDKDIAPDSGGNNSDSEILDGYIAVQINLPQDSSTRADDDSPETSGTTQGSSANDQFDDGLPSEYEIKNATIYLFKGASQTTATFYKAVSIGNGFLSNSPDNDNITSSYITAVPVEKLTGSDHYWALAVINKDADTSDVNKEATTGVKLGGTDLTVGTSKLQDILNIVTINTNFKANGFFMTNSPVSTAKGAAASGATIEYLADLGSNTYDTEAEAKEKCKGCIYVERALAKVTYDEKRTTTFGMKFIGENGEELTGDKVPTITASIQYALTNTNNKSYLVRNVKCDGITPPQGVTNDHFDWDLLNSNPKLLDRTKQYRMTSSVPMPALGAPFHDGTKDLLYRTYWCYDPNYSNVMGSNDKTIFTLSDNFSDTDEPLYCRENTFNVANMSYNNTTIALFKVTYTINNVKEQNLFIRDGDKTKVYISNESASSVEITRIIKDTDFQAALVAALEANSKVLADYKDENGVITVDNIMKYLNFSFSTSDNELKITNVELSLVAEGTPFNSASVTAFKNRIGDKNGTHSYTDTDGKTQTPQLLKNLLNNVNLLSKIEVYEKGVSYYAIPIMHFGETHTPWDKSITGKTTTAVYNGGKTTWSNDTHSGYYLGRYGMVRNNWYELYISTIQAMGTPTIPNVDIELSDDNNENSQYIALEVHVLSWAKRTQKVDF